MEKPALEGHITAEQQPTVAEAKSAAEPPQTDAGATPPLRTYAWWLVLGVIGLDCFSTLGYLPTLAVEGAGQTAPLAAVVVALLLLFAALPLYLYVVGRSPHGRGATGLLERHLGGWSGKLLLLFLLGFVATDFVMTRTLSAAAAAKHLLAEKTIHSGVKTFVESKEDLRKVLVEYLPANATNNMFAWWNEQVVTTVALMLVGFLLYFFVIRGFTAGFVYRSFVFVIAYLALNAVILGSSLVYLIRHPEYVSNWAHLMSSTSYGASKFELFGDFVRLALSYLPAVLLGLSGFELSMTCAPLVEGDATDDPTQPRGRIRNMRKLLTTTALLMSLLVVASVASVKFLVPEGELNEGGAARDRALSYLAHGGNLHPPGETISVAPPSFPTEEDSPDEGSEEVPPDRREVKKPAPGDIEKPSLVPIAGVPLNPLFGPTFGIIYDIFSILVLFLAGASVTIGLRDLLPQYLARYGMEMHWARRIGILLHSFNAIVLIVVIAFHASVSQQQGAYTTSVLVLLAGAALAVFVDLRARKQLSFLQSVALILSAAIGVIFLLLACWVSYETPTGLVIALSFVALLLVSAGLSRWMRSTELRYYGFTFADEESGVRWEQIRRLEFQVLVPHRPDRQTLADKEAEIRARHRLAPEVPIIFIEAELGDPSDFQQHPLMQIVKQEGRERIRVSQCASIAHVLAAIALEFREIGRPPEMHFTWSDESPLASNLDFLLWGQGNIPWLVHALIRNVEPDPARQPRVVIG